MSYVTTPFSLRMEDSTREDLLEQAARSDASPSKLVNRYVKEGLRMDKHPAIAFRTSPQGRRSAVLAARPGLQLIDIIGTWQAERQDLAATAKYFHVGDDEVNAVLRYYADYKDEIDQDLRANRDAQENYKRVLEQRDARTRRRVANA